ncbi:uncharacterized protein EAE98_007099 [Botrytis deweyae]|uniref:Heterokaryon incompatibility domain-containing protein n=1 Tax=Botrytis deweyae TaxID=2478750 RepID=A0ABQ7IID2_9HELO|nr:uncharacterized protein EAE98_007099 [Botrytis deweyae]KAF7925011.1 hypothetical protein EAE98_007099 [Botrytis deweyae]
MFCETCTDFLRTIADALAKGEPVFGETWGSFKHHATYNAFKRALDKGCALCKKIWAQIDDEALNMVDDELAAFGLTFRWHLYLPWGDQSNIAIWIAPAPDNAFRLICSIFLTKIDPSKDRLLLPGYQETTNTGSDACFVLANHWLKTCMSSHRRCEHLRPPSLKEWTPSRLIRIKGINDLVLCLRKMGNIPIGVDYATLSHCWGNIPETQRLVLTSENISTWTRGILGLESMKTFDHAVIICQKLGLEYIWIDSLCILQNCQDDWRQEASLMSTVYKYSKCTITATAAIDDTAGCFFDRDLDICLPTRVEFSQNQIYFRSASKQSIPNSNLLPEDSRPKALQGYYDIQEEFTWTRDISNAPVNQRSWVVQERLLSPRVLHFSDRQLIWECAELQASESSPFGTPIEKATNFKTLSPLQHQDQYLTDLDLEVETPSQKYERLTRGFLIWDSALSAYTRGKLSKGSDKLVAISAIARELQPFMRCRYLAGLWEVDLVFQLAWRSGNSVLQSRVYRAPSWSWASIDGRVILTSMYLYSSSDYLVEILEVVIDLVGEDEFGQVQGGHLKLLGKTIDLEVLDENEKPGPGPRKVLFNGKPRIAMITEDDVNMRTKTSINQLYCLPIHLHFDRKCLYLKGLILECVDVTRNEYRRVGLLEYFTPISVEIGYTGKVSIEDPFLSSLGDIEQTGDDSLVFKKESAGLREITII